MRYYGRTRTPKTPEQQAAAAAFKASKAAEKRECQVCERHQATKGGRLVHHGYQRPGVGFIVGDCMGVGHLPFPETNALEAYLPNVIRYAERQEELAQGPATITWEIAYVSATWQKKAHHVYATVPATFEAYSDKVDALSCELVAYEGAGWPSREWPYSFAAKRAEFERLVAVAKAKHEVEARHARAEQARVEARIATGREQRAAAVAVDVAGGR